MTIGLNNILTSLVVLMALGAGLFSGWMGLDRLADAEISYVVKFFMIGADVLTLGLLVFLVVKFKVIIVTKDRLMAIYVFRLKKTTILKDNIKSRQWSIREFRTHKFLSLTIQDKSDSVFSISDFEFENFQSIVQSIIGTTLTDKAIRLHKEQAKANYWFTYALASFALLAVIIGFVEMNSEGSRFKFILFFLMGLTLLFVALKRRKKYQYFRRDDI